MKALLDRTLQAAAVVVLFALALRWAWGVVRPLVPVILALIALSMIGAFIYRRFRGY